MFMGEYTVHYCWNIIALTSLRTILTEGFKIMCISIKIEVHIYNNNIATFIFINLNRFSTNYIA